MCFWREVYYIFCRHYSRDPVERIDAKRTDERCEDRDADDKEMESQTANGTPYIKAELAICMDCKYRKALREQAASKRGSVCYEEYTRMTVKLIRVELHQKSTRFWTNRRQQKRRLY